MKLLDWYIAKKYLSTFIFSIAILAAISCVIDYSEKVEDFVLRKAPVEAILWYYINFIPYIVNFLFPLFVFIATVFFTSKLAGRSEIIAILATGTDYRRFLKPYIVAGLNERLNMQPELRAHYAFTLKDLVQDLDSKDAMTTPRLWSYIQQEKLRGRETLNALYIELHRRTATPFACFILTIMGVCIASTKKRGGGGVHLAIGIFVSAVFFMITQFSSILSTKAGFSPFLATWIPNLIFSCIAYLLYKKQIK